MSTQEIEGDTTDTTTAEDDDGQRDSLDGAEGNTGNRLKASNPLYWEVVDFLWNEAALLDQDRLDEWLALLSDDIRYVMPVRTTVHRRDGTGFVGDSAHFDEDIVTLRLRATRVLKSLNAFAEDPPSRVLRYVTNIRASHRSDGRIEARSYVLLVRNRWDNPEFEFLAAERVDLLRSTPEGFRLDSREIFVQQSRLGVNNVALFL